jgi:type IX secretion system PorP/SprF family membrane protein
MLRGGTPNPVSDDSNTHVLSQNPFPIIGDMEQKNASFNILVSRRFLSEERNGISRDAKAIISELKKSDKISLLELESSTNILNDQSNGGGLQNSQISASSAYHIKMDELGNKTLGLGFQGSYHERKINLAKLNFEEQFTGEGFVNTLPTGEVFTDINNKYFDFNAGLIYNNRDSVKGIHYYIGASAYNILEPTVALTNLQYYHLPSRYSGHAGLSVRVSQLSDIKFSATYLQMAKATNLTIGAAWDRSLDSKSSTNLILGSWYRWDDALIPYVGFRKNSFQLGLTYDATVSSLKTLSITRNAYEISFIYIPWDGTVKRGVNWY